MPKIPHVYLDEASGSYYAVASLGFDSITGKRIQKKKRGFRTQAEAKVWYEEFMAKHSKKRITHGVSLTMEQFLENYFIPDYKNKVRERTFLTFRSKLNRLSYFFKMKLVDIQAIHVKNWHTTLFDIGLSNNYIKDLHQTLKEVFDMAILLGILSDNPAKKAGHFSRTKIDYQFWTQEEFQKFIVTYDKTDVLEHLKFITCYFLFMTGLRIGELQALSWRDIDFEDKSFMVNKSMFYQNKNNWQITPPKTPTSTRRIYLDEDTIRLLLDWKEHQSRLGNIDFIFSYNCLPITKTMLKKSIVAHCELSQVKVIKIHDFRRSHASLLVALGLTPLEVQKRLGHADIKVTLGIYAHLRPDAFRSVADKLSGTIKVD